MGHWCIFSRRSEAKLTNWQSFNTVKMSLSSQLHRYQLGKRFLGE